ncbi:ornithine decarboxylase 1-like [Schistocerca cancellata]|uniref:ornithine decarboxylase 1-like n=1 Tax=Schistocerca cancellata TaxID=274614 RepID=UPI0021188EFB|nr:ornithine decarboxylase 1-like [Schistocerca cancellata]
MQLSNNDELIHVMDTSTNVWSTIKDIADSGLQEDPFCVCDVSDIIKKHEEWIVKLPRIQPFYAVKCNDSLNVIRVLAALGTGFDCASEAEINKVLSVGVNPRHIIFAHPAKPLSHIRHAAAVGVSLMTFDSECELHKIKNLFPTARLVIRIRCDAAVAKCYLGKKFGCNPEKDAPRLMTLAHSLGLEIVGVSFHVGSGCDDPPAYQKAIAAARKVFDHGLFLGFSMKLLDIGGGFPGHKGCSMDRIAEVVNNALEEFFPDCGTHVIAEPGRFYVASAYTLAANVHSKRELRNEKDGSITSVMYYINDGVYGTFNFILYEPAEVRPIPLKGTKHTTYPSSIWGPTCNDRDKIINLTLLPELDIGDWLVFENMGAYNLQVASPFSGFPIPVVYTVIDEQGWKLLKNKHPMTESHFVIGNKPANLPLGTGSDIINGKAIF